MRVTVIAKTLSTPDLMGRMSRRPQRSKFHTVEPEGTMLPWIALACRQAREAAKRNQTAIAGHIDVSQAAIARFENAESWPQYPDRTIGAYASVLGITAHQLWATALTYWTTEGLPDAQLPEPGIELTGKPPSVQSPIGIVAQQ